MFRLETVIILALLLLANQPVRAASEDDGRIRVAVTGVRSDRGYVRCSIWSSALGFPRNARNAVQTVTAEIANRQAVCDFKVSPGTYAVAVYHDENANGKFDTGLFGIPKEGYGASNDARGFMGPPRFNDAKFIYKGRALDLEIRLNY